MLRKILSKIFTSRVFFLIFSLFVAVALWMYVEYSENREDTYSVSNVPVVFRGEEILADRSLLISSSYPKTVTLQFDCPRSVGMRLNNQTLSVEVDVTSVTSTGPTALLFDIIYPDDVNIDLITRDFRSVNRITLIIDRQTSWTVPVRVDYRGGTANEDLVADAEIYDPQTIIVSGPEEVVSRIKQAFVPIPKENLASTYTGDLGFMLLDENGDQLDESLLSLVTPLPETIHVIIPVKQTKNVPLSVAILHGAGSTDQNTSVVCDPAYVTLAGEPAEIRDFNSITLGTIDTTRFRERTTEPFMIIIPNNLTNLSGETEASVSVEIMGLDPYFFSTSNLHVMNAPTDDYYRIEIKTQSLDVWVRGKKEDLELISEDQIRVVADLTGANTGTARYPAKVFIDGTDADVGAVGDYRITVAIIREAP